MKEKSALKLTGIHIILFGLLSSGIISCSTEASNPQSDSFWDNKNQLMLLDFEEETLPTTIQTTNSTLELVSNQGVTHGKQALKISFKGDEENGGFELRPDPPIDASQFNNFCLVFDVTNITKDYSAYLYVTIYNPKARKITRSAAIPVGRTKTCYFELAGVYLHIDTGLRDDPAPWDTKSLHMKMRGLKAAIDFSKIASIKFYMKYTLNDKTVILDNIRLVESPQKPADYLIGIVDKFGQNAKKDFAGKIHSDEQLKALADAELKELAASKPMTDRGTYGGWKDGPQLEATGYFRTEKVGDRWALVDPEGYLFFSTGIANVRMANTTTFTGIDFKNDKVRYRDPEDVTPEDSRGMVTLTEDVTSTAYVAYPERHKMFLELPSYDSPLANHYSYRRESHFGPFKHGETFGFYHADNLTYRKFGRY